MTLVPLEAPLTSSSAWWPTSAPRDIALKRGPRYVRTRTMSRWHRVRSGIFHPAWEAPYGHRRAFTSYHLWCGQGTHASKVITALTVTDGVPACAVCEGKAVGIDPAVPEWIHTPRLLKIPRWCPTGQPRPTAGLYEEVPDPRGWPRVGICRLCRAVVPVRAKGGIYNSYVGLAQHEPLELIPGCPFHAWRDMVYRDGRTACRCEWREW